MKLMLRVARWRCLNPDCAQMTFSDRLPQIVAPYSHRTRRVVDLAHVLAHTAGGRPAERLMACLGAPQSKDTLLRSLKRGVTKQAAAPVRVVGVDDWSWRKGSTYGTIMVDLERREVLDGLCPGWWCRRPLNGLAERPQIVPAQVGPEVATAVILGKGWVVETQPEPEDRHDDEVDGPRAASVCQDEAVEFII